MARFKVEVTEYRTYEVDADGVKERYPSEYADFLARHEARGVEPNDKAWVQECFDGDPGLFDLVGQDVDAVVRGI